MKKTVKRMYHNLINRVSVLMTVFSVLVCSCVYNPASLAADFTSLSYDDCYIKLNDHDIAHGSSVSTLSYSVPIDSFSVIPFADAYAYHGSYIEYVSCSIYVPSLGKTGTVSGDFCYPFSISFPYDTTNNNEYTVSVNSIDVSCEGGYAFGLVGLGGKSYLIHFYADDLATYEYKLIQFTLIFKFSCMYAYSSPFDPESAAMTVKFSGLPSGSVPSWAWDCKVSSKLPSGSSSVLGNNVQAIKDGYDSTTGSSAQSTLDSSLSGADQQSTSLFTSASSTLSGFQLTDISAFSAVASGLSFVSSTMTSIYEALGGVNGAGIVLSVGCSVLFVSFVIGAYKFYNSKKGG